MNTGCKVTPKPKSIKEFFTTWYFWRPFLGVTIGILAGIMFYCFVESQTISCSITNDTWNSMLIGAFMGFFVTTSPCARLGR
jgi:hypothetical protein